jgi:hypothetical protein
MVDLGNVPAAATLTPDDFSFRFRDGKSEAWSDAPPPAQVAVRRGAGRLGTDRVTLVWPDGLLRNGWLEVTVKANERTGLASPDVFAFGNLAGEADWAGTVPTVDARDFARVRAAAGQTSARIDNPYDLNRDGRVSALDVAVVRQNMGRRLAGPYAAPQQAVVAPPVREEEKEEGEALLADFLR